MWTGDALKVTLQVDLTRYHPKLTVGATGTLVPHHKVRKWGNFPRFGAVDFGETGVWDIVLTNLTIHDPQKQPDTPGATQGQQHHRSLPTGQGGYQQGNSMTIQERIEAYHPTGGLDTSSKLFLHMAAVRHPEVKAHCERVALLAEGVALRLQKDAKAAFFAGLLHDIGKTLLPAVLFDGHNITAEEYALVKEHAYDGFSILKEMHLFTALVCGAHHAMYKAGYGVKPEDLPQEWGLATIKKVLEIATIVSVCDFIDAYTNRKTTIKDGTSGADLKGMLMSKYQDDLLIVHTALEVHDASHREDS